MAIDIEFASNFIKGLCLTYIGKTFKSTLWTAVLIVVVTLTIVIILYPKGKNISTSNYIKPVMYTFLTTLLLLFIHDSSIHDSIKLTRENESAENVIDGITMFRGKESKSGGVYEAVYGKDDQAQGTPTVDVKTRLHESIGGNSYVVSTPVVSEDAVIPGQTPVNNQSSSVSVTNSFDIPPPIDDEGGKIVNISKEVN